MRPFRNLTTLMEKRHVPVFGKKRKFYEDYKIKRI